MNQIATTDKFADYKVQHHPSEAMLMDYAMGNLPAGHLLAVDVHLEKCPACRSDLTLMAELGGTLLEDETAAEQALAAPSHAGLDAIFAHLPDQLPAENVHHAAHSVMGMPSPISQLLEAEQARLGALPQFKKRAPGIQTIPLLQEGDGTYSRIMRIEAGKSVPHHSHTGLELTVLISGSYEDEISLYGPGDFVEHGEEIRHQPIAGSDQPCICLGVTDHPLVFTKPLYRVLRPFFPV